MTIGILKSPNPRNRNSISVIKSKFLSVSLMNTLLAILKVTDVRRDVILAGGLYHRFPWRHLPPPLVLQARLAVSNLTILISCYVVGRLRLTLKHSVLLDFLAVLSTNLDLFGGSKVVQYDWLLASQSGCCRLDPFCPKAWVVFFNG